jgi:hypothetical protein
MEQFCTKMEKGLGFQDVSKSWTLAGGGVTRGHVVFDLTDTTTVLRQIGRRSSVILLIDRVHVAFTG